MAKQISLYSALAFVVIALVVGIGAGYYLTPEYRTSMYSSGTAMNLGPADELFNLRYINQMIAHHRGAVLLGEQLGKNTKRPELQSLAAEIATTEPQRIAELYAWKKAWFGDSRMVRDPRIENLGSYDENFDLRFLNALIAHHNIGILMARDAESKASKTEVLANAQAVDAFLSGGVKMLEGLRKQWYNI
jgi:uncharacterized protein (DUF305 family)